MCLESGRQTKSPQGDGGALQAKDCSSSVTLTSDHSRTDIDPENGPFLEFSPPLDAVVDAECKRAKSTRPDSEDVNILHPCRLHCCFDKMGLSHVRVLYLLLSFCFLHNSNLIAVKLIC